MAASVVLDWRGSEHWSPRLYRCRLCPGLTQLRDEEGRPCHKCCAEQEATHVAGRDEEEATEWNGERGTA